MILTGKAKEDFIKYASYNYGEDRGDLEMMRSVMRNALIIDFLDTSELLKGFNSFENIFYMEYRSTGFKDRKKAIEKAIEKANLIYNNRV